MPRNRRSPKKLARRMKPTRSSLSRKKGSARARNPKKMRGGVTRRRLSQLTQQELSTALQLLPADVVKQIGKRHPLLIPPFTNKTLRRAVKDYLAGGARKERIVDKYGEISNWDVSKVTNMYLMFCGATSFNHSVGGSFAARWARVGLKRCSSERGEREKRFYRGGKDERRRTAF